MVSNSIYIEDLCFGLATILSCKDSFNVNSTVILLSPHMEADLSLEVDRHLRLDQISLSSNHNDWFRNR